MITYKIVLLVAFASAQASGQYIGLNRIDESGLRKWIAASPSEYEGVYHFGFSEMETDLIIVVTDGIVCAQIRSGRFSEDGKAWIWDYENIQGAKITGNRFHSDKGSGEYVTYRNGSESKGLKINNPWSAMIGPGEYEIGIRNSSLEEFLSGEFIGASLRILSRDELQQLDKQTLRLMRNEIFARYGFIFRKGEDMAAYFAKQKWYQEQHENVAPFLTDIEKTNIKLIQEAELQ